MLRTCAPISRGALHQSRDHHRCATATPASRFPIADSITTWRMAMLASTASGALGSGDIEPEGVSGLLRRSRSAGHAHAGRSRLAPRGGLQLLRRSRQGRASSFKPEDWFSLDDDTAEKTVAVESGRVGGSQFTLSAKRIGKFKLTLSAHMDGRRRARDDIVVREIEVDSQRPRAGPGLQRAARKHACSTNLHFPADAIPDATQHCRSRLYPGPLSQVIEGMDSILSMPGGCFEQTSSSTYPNVLALDYMKRTKKLTPEIHAKAEGYIANGYQRLLTFEVPGGGFSWFGQAPANKILTAYGLMEFNDMAKVSDVDPRADRAHPRLAGQPAAGGRKLEAGHLVHQRRRDQPLQLRRAAHHRLHCLVAGQHRLPGSGGREGEGSIIERASERETPDAYTLAVIANFAVEYGKRSRLHAPRHAGAARRAQRKRTSRSFGARKRPACTRPARAQPLRRPAWPRRRCSSGARHPRRRARRWPIICVEKRGLRHLGHHAGHHHGAARAAAGHATERVRRARHAGQVMLDGKAVETLRADGGEQRLAAPVCLQGDRRARGRGMSS